MGARNSVVEHAVECNSWGKSGDELLCRFLNNEGLHRISGDAPLETRILLTYVLMGMLLGTIVIILVAWTEFCYKLGVR